MIEKTSRSVHHSPGGKVRHELRSIGQRLISIRGYESQAVFAQRVGIHKNTIGTYERGEREIGAKAMGALVREGWNANWILTGDGPERFDALPDREKDLLLVALRLPGWEAADDRINERIQAFSAGVTAATNQASTDRQGLVRRAVQLLREAVDTARADITPDQHGEATVLLLRLLEKGFSDAEVRSFAQQTVAAITGQQTAGGD